LLAATTMPNSIGCVPIFKKEKEKKVKKEEKETSKEKPEKKSSGEKSK